MTNRARLRMVVQALKPIRMRDPTKVNAPAKLLPSEGPFEALSTQRRWRVLPDKDYRGWTTHEIVRLAEAGKLEVRWEKRS